MSKYYYVHTAGVLHYFDEYEESKGGDYISYTAQNGSRYQGPKKFLAISKEEAYSKILDYYNERISYNCQASINQIKNIVDWNNNIITAINQMKEELKWTN